MTEENLKRKTTHQWYLSVLNEKYGENTVVCTLKDQYYNMREKVEDVMFIVDIAKKRCWLPASNL